MRPFSKSSWVEENFGKADKPSKRTDVRSSRRDFEARRCFNTVVVNSQLDYPLHSGSFISWHELRCAESLGYSDRLYD